MDQTALILQELTGLYGEQVLRDMSETIRMYALYDGSGQDWKTPDVLDYAPSKNRTNWTKKLIKKESGFMVGRTPEITLRPVNGKKQEALKPQQEYLEKTLKENRWSDKLLKGCRDCFIGKRVALKLTGEPGSKIGIQFRNSLEFVYDTLEDDVDKLSKVIFFYQTNDESRHEDQRVWKQKYELIDGKCILHEAMYDGNGKLLEVLHDNVDTGLDFIPVYVWINDGLSGDMLGESDVLELEDNQRAYNRLKSDDLDALRFGMFPQRVFTDADGASLEAIKLSPGAMIDLQTEAEVGETGRQATAQMLEASLPYDSKLENTINRIKNDMFDLLEIPNVGLEQLKGLMQSGKSMKALYWSLICRCEEKWAVLEPMLDWLVRSLMKMSAVYKSPEFPGEAEFTVFVDHMYPILEDEDTERQSDLAEVAQQVRSRKSYIDKWDIAEDPEDELRQIATEQSLLQESFTGGMTLDEEQSGVPGSDQTGQESTSGKHPGDTGRDREDLSTGGGGSSKKGSDNKKQSD